MGLAQKIQFHHSSSVEVEKFISNFCQSFPFEKVGDLFILSSPNNSSYRIELAVENYGLYIHRSGNYFEILGKLIEEVTGKFGKVIIEDH